MTHSSTAARNEVTDDSRRRRIRAGGVLGGVGAALLVWVLAVPVAGVDLSVTLAGRTQTIGLPAVLGLPLAAGLAGWAALAVLEARVARVALRLWTAAAVAVAVLSLAGPLTSADSTAAALVMGALHLAVAAVLVPVMWRTGVSR